MPRNDQQIAYYKNPDNDKRGLWNSATYTCNKTKQERPNLFYPITNPNTGEKIFPKETAVWKYSQDVHRKHVQENLLYWGIDGKAKFPRIKQFLNNADGVVPRSIWSYSDVGHTQEATQEFLSFFPSGGFTSPKPSRLIKRILQIATNSNSNDIVVDFFAGSGTTAQAVLETNFEDGGNRRFICVQLPEVTDPRTEIHRAGYKVISDITRERIQQTSSKISKNQGGTLNLAIGASNLGFKVYKLASSNFKVWQEDSDRNIQTLQVQLLDFENPLVDGWREQNVISEILLAEGFPLNSKVTNQLHFFSNKVLKFDSEFLEHKLFICLDELITEETAQQLQQLGQDDVFICLDSALTDQAKMRLSDVCNIKTI